MRISSCLAAWLAVFASNAEIASAAIAYVLTFGPQTAQSKHQISLASLSPSHARLVLAQRLGVEDYHTTSVLSDAEIEIINRYGTKTSLFDTPLQRALLLAELPEEHDSHTKLRLHARFTIGDAPDLEASQDLLQDLYSQSHPQTISNADLQSEESLHDSPMIHVSADANTLIKVARALAAKKVAVTALLIPAGQRSSSWGTYDMPSVHQKRQTPHTEELLEPTLILASNSSNSTSNYTNNTPLKGILPACFSSRRTCESRTRGCTGHGACELKWTNTDHPDSSKSGECWGCVCSPTKSKGSTTKWAGPACQKKDISVEFWLITLFTIGLCGLVAFAIGNMLHMGNEELPSVLGAGVSGPTARK